MLYWVQKKNQVTFVGLKTTTLIMEALSFTQAALEYYDIFYKTLEQKKKKERKRMKKKIRGSNSRSSDPESCTVPLDHLCFCFVYSCPCFESPHATTGELPTFGNNINHSLFI